MAIAPKGNLIIGQAKLTIKEKKDVSAHFGFTFDLDSILASPFSK